jgi:hypothetical protein
MVRRPEKIRKLKMFFPVAAASLLITTAAGQKLLNSGIESCSF